MLIGLIDMVRCLLALRRVGSDFFFVLLTDWSIEFVRLSFDICHVFFLFMFFSSYFLDVIDNVFCVIR